MCTTLKPPRFHVTFITIRQRSILGYINGDTSTTYYWDIFGNCEDHANLSLERLYESNWRVELDGTKYKGKWCEYSDEGVKSICFIVEYDKDTKEYISGSGNRYTECRLVDNPEVLRYLSTYS